MFNPQASSESAIRRFDLNIEKVLEHWAMAHAVRELIANALDEQSLTGTTGPDITKDDQGAWHIRDFGRGIRYEHLTQKENKEKQQKAEQVIGKFGVGLKDALATADRRRVGIHIRSKFGDITVAKASKHGFSDVKTLHANILPPSDPDIIGTDFILSGLNDKDIEEAKGFFLKYSGDKLLETTQYGQMLAKHGNKATARIYVNGLCVAEEPNFLFSYNITSLNTKLLKAMNRERTNVGRSAYTDRVKSILLSATNSEVMNPLADELERLDAGNEHDEVRWTDVALHACKILNASEKVVFVTSYDLTGQAAQVAHAKSDGYRVIIVPGDISSKLPSLTDMQGAPVRNLARYTEEWNESFEYKFIDPSSLKPKEQSVFALKESIFEMVGEKRTKKINEVLISETMRYDYYSDQDADGLWEGDKSRIILKRSILKSPERFTAVLLHEITHAFTGATDLTQKFEDGLTELLGVVGEKTPSA